MPLFGFKPQKKTRIARAADIGASMTFSGRLKGTVRRRSVLFRLCLCLLSIVAMIVVTEAWQVPFQFRLGDHVEHGVLARVTFRQINRVETDRARFEQGKSAEPVYDVFERGTCLVEPGQVVDEDRLRLLQAEHEAVQASFPLRDRAVRVAVVFVMLVILAFLIGYYLVKTESVLVRSPGRLCLYFVAIVAAVALGRVLSFDPWRAEVIPLLVAVMVFTIAYDQVFATLTAFTLSLILTLSTVGSIGHFVLLMSVCATAVIGLPRVSSRSTLIKVGFAAGVAYFVVSCGNSVLQSASMEQLLADWSMWKGALRGAGWCLAAGYLVAGSLPFIEAAYGVVTDISLLELSDISHPLLQELIRRAPGTYNHSVTVATIGEAAADAIGANGLLVRVGAYFHDIGKMLKPEYFVENNLGDSQSRHSNLAPAMSTLIIIGHVKDGVDLAKQYNLPPRIIDFIEQHQGTTLVQFFYHEATKQAGQQPDHRTDAEESRFRYPGPKPQSKETAVMLLADAVESASRTLSDPTPKRIESLVHKIVMNRLLDGQLDESGMTLTELKTVEESLTKSLIGIYHGRIKYPEPLVEEKSA